MTGDEYTATLDALTGLCQALQRLDLHGALEVVSRAQTLGPILDPTAYRDSGSRLTDAERLLRSALHLQHTVEDLAVQS